MKVRQKMQKGKISSGSPVRIKSGNVKLILTDRDGNQEIIADHNMQTNGINELLRNCGWLNRDDFTQSDLVEELLGGVMLLDTALTEDADIVTIPDGVKMIANASIGTTNSDQPTELGSYNAVEMDYSETHGWLSDGTWLAIYDWNTSQGNCAQGESIACIVATSRQHGLGGEGNSHSGEARSSKVAYGLHGTPTEYTIQGVPCCLSLEDSTVYGVDLSELGDGKVTIRKYRLPIGKVNLKGKPSAPYVLEETVLDGSDVPSNLASIGFGGYDDPYAPCLYRGTVQDTGETLNILTVNTTGGTWGTDYTQRLYEIDPEAGTITESTLSNTSGATLHAMCNPVWLSRNRVAFVDGYDGYTYGETYGLRDGTKVYSMERSQGSWGAMQLCNNAYGTTGDACGFDGCVEHSEGRALIRTSRNIDLWFDFDVNAIWPTNAYDSTDPRIAYNTDAPLIGYWVSTSSDNFVIHVVRKACYIATIFNLSSPVTKDGTKTMKLQYSFEFEEEE